MISIVKLNKERAVGNVASQLAVGDGCETTLASQAGVETLSDITYMVKSILQSFQ